MHVPKTTSEVNLEKSGDQNHLILSEVAVMKQGGKKRQIKLRTKITKHNEKIKRI
jgi:hypothetical protein